MPNASATAPRHWSARTVVVAVLLVAAACSGGTTKNVRTAAEPASTGVAQSSTTTSPASASPTSTTSTTAAPTATEPEPATTIANPAPTEPTTPTTAEPPASTGSWSLTPTSGRAGSFTTVQGDGCLVDGSGAGLGFQVILHDANDTPYAGDGGAVAADGTWHIPTSMGGIDWPPGQYRVTATCRSGTTIVFAYPDLYFTITS